MQISTRVEIAFGISAHVSMDVRAQMNEVETTSSEQDTITKIIQLPKTVTHIHSKRVVQICLFSFSHSSLFYQASIYWWFRNSTRDNIVLVTCSRASVYMRVWTNIEMCGSRRIIVRIRNSMICSILERKRSAAVMQ